ncbi:MAG: hypothetical protein ACM339_01640 [Ignavibacteria bacterium]
MKFSCFTILILCLHEISAQDISLHFFPDNKIYSRYYADPLAHQFSLSKHLESSEWFGNIGAQIAFSDFIINNYIFQLSVGATSFNTLIKKPGHIQVYTADYLVDFFLDYEIQSGLKGRFILGHFSAHYSDDGITQLNNVPISYVRDYIGLHLQNSVPALNGKFYGGFYYNFHNEPVDKHFTYQLGLEGGFPLIEEVFLYSAFDVKIKSEVEYGTTQSYQLGVIFPYRKQMTFRIAYTHRRGFEERGQLYNMKDVKNIVGLFLDF